MLNRTEAPKFYTPEFKPFTSPTKTELKNGIKIYSFNSGDQKVFKIELIFLVGVSTSSNPAVPTICLDMLREGTRMKSGIEINSTLDYYGAFLNFSSGIDHTIITLFGRSVFMKRLVPLLAEIISEPIFTEEALNKHKKRMIQKLLINQEKTSYWAPRLLRKSIFGEKHPYSKFISTQGINQITRDDLIGYHQNFLSHGLQNIIAAGSYDEKEFSLLIHNNFQKFSTDINIKDITNPIPNSHNIEVKKLGNTSQASIAIGKQSMTITTKNYPKYAFLTKVLGGYFGSRLMKKLREKEGLTYGIHAYNIQLIVGSYLQISADVELNSVEKSIELILKEIEYLTTKSISSQEIQTVKNYMIGEFVNDSNTVFDYAELYKNLILHDLPENYYKVYYNNISQIEPEEIRALAISSFTQKYFSIIKVL